jgi:membrane dipeptidase
MPPRQLWFDAHLDLAYLAVLRRDMLAELEQLDETTSGPDAPAAVTLPELSDAGVRIALGTIFTAPGEGQPYTYPADDTERANAVGRAQLEVYLTWRDRGYVALDLKRALRRDPGVGITRGGMGVAELQPLPIEQRIRPMRDSGLLHLGLLMENADPIRTPDELPWWAARGVMAIGMAWATPSRYAGGNSCDLGLTDLGRALVDAIDALQLVHDASHLSVRSLDELLERTSRPIVATHSNPSALLGGRANPSWQRHLSDDQISAIVSRGGIIGINLFSAFLRFTPGHDGPTASIEDVLNHIEHVCAIAGDRTHVGLGSDMDGGFPATRLPHELQRPRHLNGIAAGLASRGWTDEEIQGFCWRNWVGALDRALNTPAGAPALDAAAQDNAPGAGRPDATR